MTALRLRSQFILLFLPLLASTTLCADQLEMINGDRYIGKILSLNSNIIVWKSDVLGTLNIPRDKVANINLASSGSTTNFSRPSIRSRPLQASSLAVTNAPQGAAA